MPLERSHSVLVDHPAGNTRAIEPDPKVSQRLKMESPNVQVVAGPNEILLVVVEQCRELLRPYGREPEYWLGISLHLCPP